MTFTRITALLALGLASFALGCASQSENGVASTQFEIVDFDGQTSIIDVLECEQSDDHSRYVATINGVERTLTMEHGDEGVLYTIDCVRAAQVRGRVRAVSYSRET